MHFMEEAQVKLSATGTINFRPGPLAGKIAILKREILAQGGGRITATEVVREGLLGCWEQVRSHLLLRNTTRVIDATGKPLGTLTSEEMALHVQAKRLGLDPAEILRTALQEARGFETAGSGGAEVFGTWVEPSSPRPSAGDEPRHSPTGATAGAST